MELHIWYSGTKPNKFIRKIIKNSKYNKKEKSWSFIWLLYNLSRCDEGNKWMIEIWMKIKESTLAGT